MRKRLFVGILLLILVQLSSCYVEVVDGHRHHHMWWHHHHHHMDRR